MHLARKLFASAAIIVALAPSVQAQVVTPSSSGGPHCFSPPFGAATCSLTNEYLSSNVRFSQTAVFDDGGGVFAWSGINANNIVDLLAPVQASFWSTDGLTKLQTSYLRVEAGFAAPGALQLDAYDAVGTWLGSRVSGLDGLGPNNRSYMELSVAGIHSFSVSTITNDSFGVNRIEYRGLAPVSTVPEPSSFVLLAIGAGGLLMAARRRNRA